MRSTATFTWTRSNMTLPVSPTPKRPPARPWSGRALRYVAFAPFRAGWWMASRVERTTGIVFTLCVGVAFLVCGFLLSSTLIGMLFGVPMIVAGAFLALRALY